MISTETKFLYIEDHRASRRVMELLLVEVMGFQHLTLVEDTQDILPRLEALHTSFDVIFLDVNLKPHDGYAVCAMLRANVCFQRAKIVGLTASASPSDMRRMQESGFDGAIGKPLSHDTFPEQLERILAGEPVWEAV